MWFYEFFIFDTFDWLAPLMGFLWLRANTSCRWGWEEGTCFLIMPWPGSSDEEGVWASRPLWREGKGPSRAWLWTLQIPSWNLEASWLSKVSNSSCCYWGQEYLQCNSTAHLGRASCNILDYCPLSPVLIQRCKYQTRKYAYCSTAKMSLRTRGQISHIKKWSDIWRICILFNNPGSIVENYDFITFYVYICDD